MTPYILIPEALQDLHDLWDYIAAENPDAADRVIDELFAAFERLAAIPGLGHTRADLFVAMPALPQLKCAPQ